MTESFAYEDLTWPEIARLARETPLVIPFGTGYDASQLAEAMGHPARIGWLPPVPYGWQGSAVEAAGSLLGTYVSNVAASLREDDFSRVVVLTPSERPEVSGLEMDERTSRLSLPCPKAQGGLLQARDRGKVMLIPIGHTEQHGHHLPMSTDTLIIDAIARGAVAQAPGEAVALPVMPYGVSTHRRSFAGTLNAGGRAFEDFYLGVLDALVARGFDRFYLLSGHGGNCSFLANVVKYAGERHPRIFAATAWLYLSGSQGVAALEQHRISSRGGMGHACELETSLLLHLRPDLVHMARVVDETEFITTPSFFMDWIEAGALVANPPWEDDTQTGAYGAGSLGTAEHGKRWLQAAIDEKVQHVAEIHEQHRRREERRGEGYGRWGSMR